MEDLDVKSGRFRSGNGELLIVEKMASGRRRRARTAVFETRAALADW